MLSAPPEEGRLRQNRFEFSAEFWGDRRVVCRSSENRVGPVVLPRFGRFESLDQVDPFATQLPNEANISPSEVGRNTTNAVRALSTVLEQVDLPEPDSNLSEILASSHTVQLEFIWAQVELGITYCRLAQAGHPTAPAPVSRIIRNARRALELAFEFLFRTRSSRVALTGINQRVRDLQEALSSFPDGSLTVDF